jgi:hypothetical protein
MMISRLANNLSQCLSPHSGLDGELIHLEPLGWVCGPIIFLDTRQFEVQRPTHPLQVVEKSSDSSCIAPSFGRMLLVRLIIIGTVVVIVPFFTLLLFKALVLLAPVFNLVVCISTMDDVEKISGIQVSSSATFLWWSETASHAPMGTLPVVMLVTPCFILMVEHRVNHGCCIQHRLEALHVCVDFFIMFWKVG